MAPSKAHRLANKIDALELAAKAHAKDLDDVFDSRTGGTGFPSSLEDANALCLLLIAQRQVTCIQQVIRFAREHGNAAEMAELLRLLAKERDLEVTE